MSCGNPGRCCNGPDCSTNVGACKCQCGSTSWSSDNLCTPGACWLVENGVYECLQLNPCECAYRGGEFSGSGTTCPDSNSAPPPPDPPPPDPPDPGPITVYCCEPTNGMCYAAPGFCPPGQSIKWSAEQCSRECRQNSPPPDPTDPPPDPDPVGPCDPPCGPCQDCVNGACRDRCPANQCCNGVCCAANQSCVNGVCVSSCSDIAGCQFQSLNVGGPGVFQWRLISNTCPSGCDCIDRSPSSDPSSSPNAIVTATCRGNLFP
jgi:hypothetical protein